jgi:hypothetical protein
MKGQFGGNFLQKAKAKILRAGKTALASKTGGRFVEEMIPRLSSKARDLVKSNVKNPLVSSLINKYAVPYAEGKIRTQLGARRRRRKRKRLTF